MDSMTDVISPDASKQRGKSRTHRTKKHIVVPATAEQIAKGLGITKKDKAIVRKVLLRLGYIQAENPSERKVAASRSKKKR
jgi:hypothetical protein